MPPIFDTLITEFDHGLRTLTAKGGTRFEPPRVPTSSATQALLPAQPLSPAEQVRSQGLMRINQVGEVCAQALYRGHAASTKNAALKQHFLQAAAEEQKHLDWTTARLTELHTRPSVFNPFWYAASWGLGAVAGRLGDDKSLGFMAETEHQVEQHLSQHLHQLPENDIASRQIVEAMRADEAAHAAQAVELGAAPMPALLQIAMHAMASVMKTVAYRI